MKIAVVVLTLALIAVFGFGISQKHKSKSLADELTAAQELASSNIVVLAKQIEDSKALSASVTGDLTKQIDDLKMLIAFTNLAFASQSENLQQQIVAAHEYAQKMQTRLDSANAQIAQLAPQAARARTLPVYVTWRYSWTGHGNVIQIHSTSTAPLPIIIEPRNLALGSKTFHRVVVGMPLLEIGVQEGWDFTSGDTVQISSAGFETQTFNCP